LTGHPRVSVIIPAYNGADYTVKTVESVLAQTYRDFEVIVVDDGSTDHTRTALLPYGDQIQYIYKENGGACSARNVGIRLARGEFVACLDCDDIWLPDKLRYSLPVLDSDPGMAFVFTLCQMIDGAGEIIGEAHYSFDIERAYLNLLSENYIMAPSVIMRRSCLDDVGLFDESIFIPADWDLWLRLACRYRVGYVDLPLSQYRQVSNYTLRNAEQFVREADYVLEKQFEAVEELSERQRRQLRARLLLTHALLYLKADERDRARYMLRKAIGIQPLNWRPYGYYVLSLLGVHFHSSLIAIKRRLT
jgi:glycosyltransferase involved in cell wall biosynthesis